MSPESTGEVECETRILLFYVLFYVQGYFLEDLIVKLTTWICLDSRQTLESFPAWEKTWICYACRCVLMNVNNKFNTLPHGIVNTEQW